MWIEEKRRNPRAVERYKDPTTGKLVRVYVDIEKNTVQARNKARKQLDQIIARRLALKRDGITFEELATLYMQEQKRALKESTFRKNTVIVNAFCDMFGSANVNDLTAGKVRSEFLKKYEKPSTINVYLKVFRALIRWGYANDFIDSIEWLNKLKAIKDTPKRVKIQDKFLEAEECRKLLEAMKHDDWRDLTEFLILSGLRVGEALALLESDISFKDRIISVTKTREPYTGTTTTPKTYTSNREVYMQDDLYRLTRSVVASNARNRKVLYMEGNALFMPVELLSRPYDAYNKYLARISERAIGRKITPHFLRHTHASLLAEQEISFGDIAERLGHQNSAVTQEIYIHFTEKRKAAVNDRLKKIKII